MTSLIDYSAERRSPPEPSASVRRPFKWHDSAVRVDFALLFCALFLQRFSLPFGRTFLMLDLVPVVFIVFYQFVSGKLVIQHDRFLWFLGLGLAATSSLLLNFSSTMLTSYFLFLVLDSLATFTRPSTADSYKRTLQAFQLLTLVVSCLGVAQFFAQFVLDGRRLIMFYGIVPEFLFGFFNGGGANTVHPLIQGSAILKSNGLFLAEPSSFSQLTAFGILIEILEFRRPRYLLGMALGLLVAYSGTGLMILFFLPLAGLRDARASLAALLVVIFALGLFATGIIDASAFLDRAGEFQDSRSSAFGRFVAPIQLAVKQFDTASLFSILFGNGPGTAKTLNGSAFFYGFTCTWFKLLVEYGIIGGFVFICFLGACLRRSRCPGVLLLALIFNYIFNVDFLTTPFLTMMIVLCTLNGSEVRQIRSDGASRLREQSGRYRPAAASFS